MAVTCDGTDDRISFGSDTSIDDFVSLTVGGYWFSPSIVNNGTIFSKMAAALASGWIVLADTTQTPDGLNFVSVFSSAYGNFVTTTGNLSASTRAHIAVTFNGSSASNTPIFYIDGVAMGTTTLDPQAGTLLADAGNTFTSGEDLAGIGSDGNQSMTHVIYHDAVLTAAEVNRCRWWGRPFGGLKMYHPFLTEKTANEGTATASATLTNATITSAFCPPVVRPGMGMGW